MYLIQASPGCGKALVPRWKRKRSLLSCNYLNVTHCYRIFLKVLHGSITLLQNLSYNNVKTCTPSQHNCHASSKQIKIMHFGLRASNAAKILLRVRIVISTSLTLINSGSYRFSIKASSTLSQNCHIKHVSHGSSVD